MNANIHNVVILDESGSMSCIMQQAINGYNETVQTIKAAQKKYCKTQRQLVSLITFNTSEIKTIYKSVPCEQARELSDKTYCPNAGTPLYDAMGITLNCLRHAIGEDASTRVLITIITDGEENASQEYNCGMVKKLVEELKKRGWIFTYIGANQDVDKVTRTISITNVMSFQSTQEGTENMFCRERISRNRFFDCVAENDCCESMHEDYF